LKEEKRTLYNRLKKLEEKKIILKYHNEAACSACGKRSLCCIGKARIKECA